MEATSSHFRESTLPFPLPLPLPLPFPRRRRLTFDQEFSALMWRGIEFGDVDNEAVVIRLRNSATTAAVAAGKGEGRDGLSRESASEFKGECERRSDDGG